MLTEFRNGTADVWGFASENPGGINLWFGDFNLDGYPDAVTILQRQVQG